MASNNSVKYVPQNGYGELRGQIVLTHGVELGVARASSRDLARGHRHAGRLVRAEATPACAWPAAARRVRISQPPGLGTPLVGRSALGGDERVGVYTTLLADGNLFYYVTVVPQRDAARYGRPSMRVGQSIRLNDR